MSGHYVTPQKVIFGPGALAELPAQVDGLGWRRVLLCTTGSARRSGRAREVEVLLGERLAASYDGVQPHVPEAQVSEALRLAQAHPCDAVLGLGGGSAIGLAKAVSYLLNRLHEPEAASDGVVPVPVAAIPTTYAGSEMTPIFGITAQQAGVPHGVANAIILPHAMRFNLDLTMPHLAALARAMGLTAGSEAALAQAGLDHIQALIHSLNLPQRLRESGVAEAELPRLARLAAESKTVKRNPKPVSVEDAEALLRAAW